MKKSTHWIICGLFLLVPPFLNFIIYRPNFLNFQIVGTAVDWLGFYGSYLGSALGSLTTLYVLYSTIRNSRHEQATELIHEEIIQTRDDIAEKLGQFTPQELRACIPPYKSAAESKNEQLSQLMQYKGKYQAQLYSAEIRYGRRTYYKDGFENKTEAKFYLAYRILLGDTITTIENIIQAVVMNQPTEVYSKYAQDIDNLCQSVQQVFELANEYIQSLEKDFKENQYK